MWSRNRLVVGWILLAVWIVAIGWWAVTPLTESLTVLQADGTELIGADGGVVRVDVECGAPVARDLGTPAVDVPAGATLERPVCERTQSENRTLLWINAALIAAVTVGMAFTTRRMTRSSPARPRAD